MCRHDVRTEHEHTGSIKIILHEFYHQTICFYSSRFVLLLFTRRAYVCLLFWWHYCVCLLKSMKNNFYICMALCLVQGLNRVKCRWKFVWSFAAILRSNRLHSVGAVCVFKFGFHASSPGAAWLKFYLKISISRKVFNQDLN